jgi:hypothetical protein
MKSHPVNIARYDMPIRLRPVRFCVYHWEKADGLAVVHGLYMHNHGPSSFPWLHKLLKSAPAERQVTPFLLLRHRNCCVLLYC